MQRLIAIVMAVLMTAAVTSRTLGQSAPTTEPSKCARHPGRMFKALNLTADQKAEVKAILQQARADAKNAADPQAKRQIRQAAFVKIKDTVLTDQQRAKLQQMHRGRMAMMALRQLDLTADQKAQVKAIMQQARADAQATTDDGAKREIWKSAFGKVRDTVLTDPQRAQLEQMKARHQKAPGASQPA